MPERSPYNCKAKFGGMTVSEAKRLKALAEENAKPKNLLAEEILDLAAMKELVSKSSNACREARGGRESEVLDWAFGTAGMPNCRNISHYGPLPSASRAPDTVLRRRLRDLVNERRRFGYRWLFVLLRRDNEPSGITRTYLLYCEEGLTVRQRKAKRKAVGTWAPILFKARPNERWSLERNGTENCPGTIMSNGRDQFASGQRFQVFNMVDNVSRECLAAILGRRVARELTALIGGCGKRQCFAI